MFIGLLFLCVCHFICPFFSYGKAVGAYGKRVLFCFFGFVLAIEPVYSIHGRKDKGMIWNDLLIEL